MNNPSHNTTNNGALSNSSHSDQVVRSLHSELSSAHSKQQHQLAVSAPNQQHHHQQPQPHPQQHQLHPQQHIQHTQVGNQQSQPYQHPWFFMPPMLSRQTYSGVDKLILAAMMNDPSAAAAANIAMARNQSQQAHSQFSFVQQQQAQHLQHQHHEQQTTHSEFASTGATRNPSGYVDMREAPIQTSIPNNKSELELYRLLEKANLLGYFATFISFGGDDVQQLCEADEDEFVEIMELVGMTNKPLHVRRLQKALADWRDSRLVGSESSVRFKRPNSSGYFHSNRDSSGLYATSDPHRQPSPDPSLLVESPATTPNSFKSLSVAATPDAKKTSSNQPCLLPHEVLIGAPKRPRLMDSIMTGTTSASSKLSGEDHPTEASVDEPTNNRDRD